MKPGTGAQGQYGAPLPTRNHVLNYQILPPWNELLQNDKTACCHFISMGGGYRNKTVINEDNPIPDVQSCRL